MPLYEYECQACGHHLEEQQRLADAALVTCPHCGKDQLQKVISATAFHLKGGGWYKDLYSSSKPGESSSTAAGTHKASSSESSATSSAGSGSASSESSSTPAASASAPAPAASTTPSSKT
ncbi:MAG: zinc ribbon domain-containing protein [Polyangia bacterium]